MTYTQVKIKDKTFWSANPKNWDELAFTVANEKPWLDYDPNNIKPDYELLNMFL